MKHAHVASVVLLLAGYWLSGHDSVRAEDDRSGEIIDKIVESNPNLALDETGSETEVRPFPANLSLVIGGGQRVLGQTLDARFGVSGLYTAARADRPDVPVIWASPAVDKLQRVLAQPLKKEGLQFQDTPLSEVADFVRNEYKIKVLLDIPSLDDLGLSPDEKINTHLSEMPLGAAIKIMLQEVDLTTIIAHDTVVIASEDEAYSWPLVAIYPVGDLLEVKQHDDFAPKQQGGAQSPEDIAHLTTLLKATCCVDGWSNGEGTIATMQPSLFIVRHREEVHQEIQDFLSALRLAKQHRFAIPLEHHQNDKKRDTRAKSKTKRVENREDSDTGGIGGQGGFGGGFGGGGMF
ncbi:hypothetical protein [Aeoliella mucimassa]|uniref:Uncharacterized protein n=1 Tax=Aeoliella mucimassa TaxID=2527972 RepID=A0A518ARM7_9BACT|nr:hypothetical protein [Aeoliella mucimassa]QDU57368.1 hypothetical protein Pan181_35830 [Aeoliella mucimassa]